MAKWKPNLASVDTFGARESVRPHRSCIDNEYQEKGYMAILPDSATLIYLALGKFARQDTQICWPSAETLMRLTGMKNKNTFHRNIKLLVHYRIIRVISGSKGRVPNVYQLLSYTLWKEINRDNFDTVKNSLKSKPTVSKDTSQQYQKSPANSGTSDTGNHISKSDKKITSNLQKSGKQLFDNLVPATASVVRPYFAEQDIITALEELQLKLGKDNLTSGEILGKLKENQAKPIKELPPWLARYGR